MQAGQKPYWFKMDEKGAIAGGIAKFINADPVIVEKVTAALNLQPNTLVFLSTGKLGEAQKTAGVMRKLLGAACEGHMDKERYEFCWIVDFPMYEIGEESGELEFCHNPFSMPSGGLETLLKAERGEMDPLDALPLFGTGTILLPWGLFRIIAGDFRLGLGLMILYGVAALSRNVLEPKLLGAQAGVSPLLTLLAIYTGYRLSGFTGMILLPIGVMIAAELFTAAHSPTAAPVETARSAVFPHPLP